jgi:hypothetical protein
VKVDVVQQGLPVCFLAFGDKRAAKSALLQRMSCG